MSPRTTSLTLAILTLSCAPAAPLATADGLTAEVDGLALDNLSLGGAPLAGARVSVQLLDPRTGRAAEGFEVTGGWTVANDGLRLEGDVSAPGSEDQVADLLIRVDGVSLPLGTIASQPLLLPAKLLSKLPLVSLRHGELDSLALAVPPSRLAISEFRQRDGGVELRFPFGFTRDARPELQMTAPFACLLYRTDPAWHFRDALAGYYRRFPAPFEPFATEQGGWFFAAPVAALPNPQHFAYWEGGPGGVDEATARGMGTYPYRESSSATIGLGGAELPRDYDEAMARLEELERQRVPAGWAAQQAFELDQAVRRSGEQSLRADAGADGVWVGALQTVQLPQPVTAPIEVSGFSRAERISGEPDNNYAIYVDVTYDDGSYLFGQCATFATGTHDWQSARHTIQPAKPVRQLRVFCLLRGHAGTAWFDDLRVGPAGEPATNWLVNPGFEELAIRHDLQYIRDNVAYDAEGRWRFWITDNLSADVRPEHPLNLLRFTLNLDPDLPSTTAHPAVAATELATFDGMFETWPQLKGAYIDSVSAWIAGVLNFRREQWPANDAPFTYQPEIWRVAPHGRFAMADYLRTLQERYHPRGKAVFTNIHVNLDSFPLYLTSDVPGIESSQFQDPDSLFFYRAASYHKPLLLLNFMNLHGLDQRDIAEIYHANAAQWGLFPSTGRYVQEAYRLYGDLTHAWVPAIREISAAGWEPVPWAEGAAVERFAGEAETTFSLRGDGRPTVRLLAPAVAGLGDDLVAWDAVALAPVSLTREGADVILPAPAPGVVQLVRVSSGAAVAPWLLARARWHAEAAGRVQGEASDTPALAALRTALTQEPGPAALTDWRAKIEAALASAPATDDNLFAISRRREVRQAEAALVALVAHRTDARLTLRGETLAFPGEALTLAPESVAGAQPVGLREAPGALPAPPLEPEDARWQPELRLTSAEPRVVTVRAAWDLTAPGGSLWRVERLWPVRFRPAVTLSLIAGEASPRARGFTVQLQREPDAPELTLQARVEPEAEVTLSQPRAEPAAETVPLRVTPVLDGLPRTLTVQATDAAGNLLGQTETTFLDEPPLPTDNLALAAGGATVTTDSNYSGYTPAALIDGVSDTTRVHWAQAAWASRDVAEPHWVQIDLPRPATVGQVAIYWASHGPDLQTGRNYRVMALTEAGPTEVVTVREQSPRAVSWHRFEPVLCGGIRLEQEPGGGPAVRPNILWLREFALAP